MTQGPQELLLGPSQGDPFDPRRLSPEVGAFLQLLSARGTPDLASLSIPEMRQAYGQLGAAFGGDPVPMGSMRDLTAETSEGSIPVRIYRPENLADEQAPATVYFHGGGWSLGDIDTHDKVTRRLAHTSGGAVVSVDYRLAPEHPAPAGPDDAIAATRWIHDHAHELALDPDRLAVAGDSAGGSLAAVVAQRVRGHVPLRAQVLFYPCTDLSPASAEFPARTENANVPPLTLSAMHAMADPFAAGFDTTDTRLSPRLATDLQGLPRTLIFAGECDTLRDDARTYRDALTSSGTDVELVEIPGMIHGFIELAGVLAAARDAAGHAGAFLKASFTA